MNQLLRIAIVLFGTFFGVTAMDQRMRPTQQELDQRLRRERQDRAARARVVRQNIVPNRPIQRNLNNDFNLYVYGFGLYAAESAAPRDPYL